jgi:hypothetical protein
MMNFEYNTQTGQVVSLWTGGTRKQCNGQYSWCFSKPLSFDKRHDLQTLASSSSNGACVIAIQNPNLSIRGAMQDIVSRYNVIIVTYYQFESTYDVNITYPFIWSNVRKNDVLNFNLCQCLYNLFIFV